MKHTRDLPVSMPPRRWRASVTAPVAALALTAGAGLAGCSGDAPDDPAPSSSGQASASAAPMPPDAHIVKVTGTLPKQRRAAVTAKAAEAVDAWFEAAYVGGDYPRDPAAFGDAFPGFTAGAKAEAQRKRALLSNADISDRIEGVTVEQKSVGLDVLGVRGRAAGITARVRLVFDTEGDVAARHTVTGQLNLVPVKGDWRVFAFDVREQQKPEGQG